MTRDDIIARLIHERIYRYAERYFQRSGRTAFPTVRETARALRLKQREIVNACEGDPDGKLMLTGYNFVEDGDRDFPGSLYVETFE